MTSEDLGFLPATELVELIRTKQLSPVEYMRALLEQLVALDRVVKMQPLLENDFSC